MTREAALIGALGCLLALAAPAAAQQCSVHDPLKLPFFGDLHIHSAFSFDAYLLETRNDPFAAYAFAQGASVGLPPLDAMGEPTRALQLRRALDFAAVTDHAEFLGETSICTTPGHAQYGSAACMLFRDSPAAAFGLFGSLLAGGEPERLAFCGEGGLGCLGEALSVWSEVQAAAGAHNDRTSACSFSTFTAYEWTGTPQGDHLHRNVVFAGDDVPALPLSYVEVQEPEALWALLEQQCENVGGDCDAISIPHNSNKSSGRSFDPLGSDGLPMTVEQAERRARVERLVEIVQHKGDSECRLGVESSDEACEFEKLASVPPANDAPLAYVRNALRTGLSLRDELGTNPYAFGLIGSTDTHLGTPGATEEDDYPGHGGIGEATPEDRLAPGSVLNSPGGLTVLWATENTREALFAAMRAREAYATSGTRPVVRFFGGAGLSLDLCDAPDFVAQAYADGVPMGGELDATTAAPRFATWALQDPGSAGFPGTPLQRIQIVKGWLDAGGQTHERVFDVVGSVDNGASVDPQTCDVSGSDFASLCSVWEDPEFDRTQAAFYYARVLENETCRWSQRLCNASQIDCSGSPPMGFEACCDGSVPATIQERAVTSPIWYLPAEAVPAARGWGPLLGAALLLIGIAVQRRREAKPRS